MDTSNLWDSEAPVRDLGIDVPAWIDSDIDAATIAAIARGGCASGAYMPAVTYHQALATMSEHGDAVLQYVEDVCGDLPVPPQPLSWSGLACHYLSTAVELWAASVEEEVSDALDAADY